MLLARRITEGVGAILWEAGQPRGRGLVSVVGAVPEFRFRFFVKHVTSFLESFVFFKFFVCVKKGYIPSHTVDINHYLCAGTPRT